MTRLRLVRALPDPTPGTLRAVGVDEFALRRGHTYDTVLVDMRRGGPVAHPRIRSEPMYGPAG
jgi:hypothetical protein